MKTKTIFWIIGIIIIIGGLFMWSAVLQKSNPDTVATRGIHWHPQVYIYVDGEKQEIPANVGLVGGHKPIHTHGEDVGEGVVHLEFEGKIQEEDVRLQEFFKVWGKEVDSFGTLTRMTVNGQDNTEYGTYMMQHEDVIELYYESVVTE